MHDDFYQMYLEELELIKPCTEAEEVELLKAVLDGEEQAKKRLIEGSLHLVLKYVKEYEGKGLPLGDLVQEGNMALMLAAGNCRGRRWGIVLEEEVRRALKTAVEEQGSEMQTEEEILARVNVLKDIAQGLAEELGREATVEELAKRMKMTVDEIKGIMKITLDAMSVNVE